MSRTIAIDVFCLIAIQIIRDTGTGGQQSVFVKYNVNANGEVKSYL